MWYLGLIKKIVPGAGSRDMPLLITFHVSRFTLL